MHGNRADPAMTERNERQTAPYPAEKARGGEIILRTPLRRAIFIAGLAGAAVLALLLGFDRFAH
nr:MULTISPECIES: peptide ABC transporter permease [unclassified Bradyrhizobium]